MTQKHTETPWKVDRVNRGEIEITHQLDDLVEEIVCGMNIDMMCSHVLTETDEANAEFIVKACNSHAKLVEALKEIQRRFDASQCDFDGCAAIADEALQQLKEKTND